MKGRSFRQIPGMDTRAGPSAVLNPMKSLSPFAKPMPGMKSFLKNWIKYKKREAKKARYTKANALSAAAQWQGKSGHSLAPMGWRDMRSTMDRRRYVNPDALVSAIPDFDWGRYLRPQTRPQSGAAQSGASGLLGRPGSHAFQGPLFALRQFIAELNAGSAPYFGAFESPPIAGLDGP